MRLEAHYGLGTALCAKGDVDGAITAYKEALRLKNEFPEAQGTLGLGQQGRFAEARAAFRRAAELFAPSHPVDAELAGHYASSCERLLALEKRLPALRAGKEQPKSNADRLVLAEDCNVKKLHALAAQFFAAAFTADAKLAHDLKGNHRYHAACAAALAASGAGKDAAKLTDAQRAAFRKQALDWLRADLDAWRGLLAREPDKARTTVVQKMQHWLKDVDFQGVRGKEALSKLPEAERAAWQQLWAEVETLRQKTAAANSP
jgi:tetratricopeptide (TPR) repeat protein